MSFDFRVSSCTMELIARELDQYTSRSLADNLCSVAVKTVLQKPHDAHVLINTCFAIDKVAGIRAYAKVAMQVTCHDHLRAKELVDTALTACRAFKMKYDFLDTVHAHIIHLEQTGQARYRSTL